VASSAGALAASHQQALENTGYYIASVLTRGRRGALKESVRSPPAARTLPKATSLPCALAMRRRLLSLPPPLASLASPLLLLFLAARQYKRHDFAMLLARSAAHPPVVCWINKDDDGLIKAKRINKAISSSRVRTWMQAERDGAQPCMQLI
jgi:hypothetical protein